MMALLLFLLAGLANADNCTELCLGQQAVCAIERRLVKCDESVKITTSTSISIVDSMIYCVDMTNKGEPTCTMTLLSNTITIERSKLVSSLIHLNATTVNISANSTLSANGTGYLIGPGNPIHSSDGPSYGGRGGGTCGEPSKYLTYGDQRSVAESYGSGGMNMYTRGGGIIIVEAENLYFHGVITASGNIALNDSVLATPSRLKGNNNGGTGGSVYIKVSVYANSTGKIIAAGGNSVNEGYGGGGGRVAIFGKFRPIVFAPGGSGNGLRCTEAGAGTIYFEDGDQLVVDNNQISTRNPTPVSTWEQMHLIVRNSAIVTPLFSHLTLVVNKLEVDGGRVEASQVAGSGYSFDSRLVIVANSIALTRKSTIGSNNVESVNFTVSNNFTIEAGCGIYFMSRLKIEVGTSLEISGDIEANASLNEMGLITIWAALLHQRRDSTIKARRVAIYSGMMLLEGVIYATHQICTTSEDFFLQHPPYHYIEGRSAKPIGKASLPQLLETNFTQLIVGTNITALENSQILGSRVAIFGTLIKLSGMVSVSWNGCYSDSGLGKGGAKENVCAGSGAGYGGRGGNGRPINDDYTKVCENFTRGGRAYSDELNPWFEGSGGGSTPVVGGAGGGFIDIEAVQDLNITGMISADGEDAPREASNLRSGSGGGSGGGIFIRARRLTGKGAKISAAGGRGTVKGGGGGGGRILFSWIGQAVNSTEVNDLGHTVSWDGIVEVPGGMPGEECAGGVSESGANGTLRAEYCAPGSAGYLCIVCPKGYYKSGTEYENGCSKCENKPPKGEYTLEGETSRYCTYECPAGYTAVSENPDCQSPLKEFFSLFGGVGGAIGVTFAALSLIALIALLMIDYCNKWQRRHQQQDLKSRLIPKIEHKSAEQKTPKKKTNLPELTKEDLPFHEHRIYLVGDNTYHRPWCLPTTPPVSIQTEVINESFASFANELNRRSRWFRWQHVTCWVLLWVYHPLGLLALNMIRKRKFLDIKDYVQIYEEEMWQKIEVRLLQNSLRVSCSEDYTLAFIDVISSSKNIVEWDERPVLPLVLLTEGDGSFYKPFRLDPNDLLLQLISANLQEDAQEEFEHFLNDFNLRLRTVRLASPMPNRNQKELLQLRTIVEICNKDLLEHAHFQAVLALFQAPMVVVAGKYTENTLSARLNSEFIDDYSDQLQRGELLKVYSFRLGLIFMEQRPKKGVVSRPVSKGRSQYYQPNISLLDSDSSIMDRGIEFVPDPVDSAPFSECSLRELLLIPKMWNQQLVLFCLSLLVLIDIVLSIQTIKLMLLLEFMGTGKIFGFIMFGCVMPGANIITPILGIVRNMQLMLALPRLTVIYVSFQIVCCSSTVMMSVYLIELQPDWFWIGFLLSQICVKLLSIRFAVMYKANVEAVLMVEVRTR